MASLGNALDVDHIASSTAQLNIDLLLCGETGTGKDTLARKIHDLSKRTGAFIGTNCAAIPEALAESELFGVVNGAYTGANRSRMGYIEAAQGGTLYLDEICSMPLTLQAKFLRLLETRGVERLGSTQFIPVNFRVIASAQKNLDDLVEQGLFRRDLYFRLNVLTVQLPALRDRREQIVPMFDEFARAAAEQFQRPVPHLDCHLLRSLLSHSWPGNLRELKSAAKRFVLGVPIFADELAARANGASSGLKTQLLVIEKTLIQQSLKRHNQSVEAVSQELEIPRRTLYHRMKLLDL